MPDPNSPVGPIPSPLRRPYSGRGLVLKSRSLAPSKPECLGGVPYPRPSALGRLSGYLSFSSINPQSPSLYVSTRCGYDVGLLGARWGNPFPWINYLTLISMGRVQGRSDKATSCEHDGSGVFLAVSFMQLKARGKREGSIF